MPQPRRFQDLPAQNANPSTVKVLVVPNDGSGAKLMSPASLGGGVAAPAAGLVRSDGSALQPVTLGAGLALDGSGNLTVAAGGTTGRTETKMVLASGTTQSGLGAAWVWYPTATGITLGAGQHITVNVTAYLDGTTAATAYAGILDGSGHGYAVEMAPGFVSVYRSNSGTTNTQLGNIAQAQTVGWVTLQLDIWPGAAGQVISGRLLGGAQVALKYDTTYPLSSGTWFPAAAAFTQAGAPTFSNIRSGWFGVDA